MDDRSANTATEPPPGHIDSLPTEVKTEVVRYLQLARDKKSLSLTSKAWAWITLPILWETLRTNFVLTENRDIYDLVQPDSNIVKHVRNLHLSSKGFGYSWDGENALPLLVAALPRNQIRGFTALCPQILDSLNLLLRLHRIEDLTLDETCWDKIAKGSHTSSLASLNRLILEVSPFKFTRENGYVVNTEFLGASSPNLSYLEIQGNPRWGEPWICLSDGMNDSKAVVQSKPSHLVFKNVSLATHPSFTTSFTTYFDLLPLRQLVFQSVTGVSGALNALASVFKTGNAQLQSFSLIQDTYYDEDIPASTMEKFLLSFGGLRQLCIQATISGRLSAPSIANHRSLRDLYLVDGDYRRSSPERAMSASDLQYIATECTSIKHMCLNICEMAGFEGPLGKSKRQDINEFESAMITLAEMPHLSVLRLTNPPNYRKSVRNAQRAKTNYQARFNQSLKTGKHDADFQVLANRFMRYLREHGSNIELLVFAPVLDMPTPDIGFEDHGPFWPYYCFMTESTIDLKGQNAVSAKTLRKLPSKFSEIATLQDLAAKSKDDEEGPVVGRAEASGHLAEF